MPLPAPEPGLVVCYEFLWSDAHDRGREFGIKRHPCAIVLATRTDGDRISVVVAPITHSPPREPGRAVEIPPAVKRHLGLDGERSWVVLDQLNQFVWPGFDLVPVPGGAPGQLHYGFLPPRLFRQVRDGILALDARTRRVVPRDE